MEALSLSTSNVSCTTQVIQITPEDAFEVVLMALRLQPGPIILLLPEWGQALCCPEHFAQVRQMREPGNVSFVCSGRQAEDLAEYARRQGFAVASSLQEAIQYLDLYEKERGMVFQGSIASLSKQEAKQHEESMIGENGQYHPHVPVAAEPSMTSMGQTAQPTRIASSKIFVWMSPLRLERVIGWLVGKQAPPAFLHHVGSL